MRYDPEAILVKAGLEPLAGMWPVTDTMPF